MEHERSLGLIMIDNARELGGYKTRDGRQIKHGLLLRTAKLSNATAGDIEKLVNEYRLGTIIDFRMGAEAAAEPDPEIEGVERYNISIMNEMELRKQREMMDIDPGDLMKDPIKGFKTALELKIVSDEMYINFLDNEAGKKGFSEFFRLLLNEAPDRAVLWHCTSGKDRTGLAAVLLMTALGVDRETCMADFLLTNEFNKDKIAQTRVFLDIALKPEDKHLLNDMLVVLDGVNESFMEKAIDFMDSKYGSVMGYINNELHITDSEIAKLKEKYLI